MIPNKQNIWTEPSTGVSLSQEMMEGSQLEHHHIQLDLPSIVDNKKLRNKIHNKPINENASKDGKLTTVLSEYLDDLPRYIRLEKPNVKLNKYDIT